MHFRLPRELEQGFRIKKYNALDILRSQVAHPPLVSPEHFCFYTFGYNVHYGSCLLSSIGLLRLVASRMVTLEPRKEHFCSTRPGDRRLYSYVLWWESSLCKTPHFQWIYGKLNQIYEKLRSDQMDPKSALGGPKPISRTGGSLLKNWSYTSNQCIYFSILLYWRPHLAKTLFIFHKYIKCALL